jgi:hypothetical protein
MSIPLRYNQYYTHFSFGLFIISLALPFSSKVKYFILLNSIIVGIVGNLIMINDYDLWVEWYKKKYPYNDMSTMNFNFLVSNFLTHTLPMIFGLVLLPFCTSYLTSIYDVFYWIIVQMIVIIIWSLWSYNGILFSTKINESYPSTQFLLHAQLISCALVFGLIAYLHK